MSHLSFFHFCLAHYDLFLTKLWQQVYLVAISMFFAIVIGMGLGIIATRFKKLKSLTINIANIFQTIPSIALLGVLLPVFGIGAKPAIIALTVYALLPIIRNTISGIENIPSASIEATRALGFSYRQRLFLVEIPLALPILLAGIRTATVMCVGIATIAAFIGAGGLGDFIYQGLSLNDNNYILLGAIPAALMALILDFSIGLLERSFSYRSKDQQKAKRSTIAVISILILITAGLAAINFPTKNQKTIVIASKNFTEQFILGNLMADMIQSRTDLHVEKRFNLGTTSMLQAALLRGSIDIYPEYTGTAYLIVLKKHYSANINPQQLYKITKLQYEKRYHLTWLAPFGFNNTEAIIVRQDFAKTHNLKTIGDLNSLNNLVIGAPPEFVKRADGLIGLTKIYHLHFKSIKMLEPDLMYKAIKNKDVNVIAGFSTDGRILAYHLLMLKDNKHFYPPYYAAPVIRMSTLKKYPQIKTALKPLAGLITNKDMQQMNYEVNVDHKTPAAVAKQFLVQHGLLK